MRITKAGAGRVFGGKVLREGENVLMPRGDAGIWVFDGFAEHTGRVRALVDHLTISNRVLAKGETSSSCCPDLARRLEEAGLVEVLEG
jgi:hypothetical protein